MYVNNNTKAHLQIICTTDSLLFIQLIQWKLGVTSITLAVEDSYCNLVSLRKLYFKISRKA